MQATEIEFAIFFIYTRNAINFISLSEKVVHNLAGALIHFNPTRIFHVGQS